MKILIVDDSKDFRTLASSFLTRELEDVEPIEYEVEELGKPADDFLWSDYDVLLLDYNLGGGENGFDWLKEFGRKTGFPPTIILTAEGDEYIAVKAIKLGAVDYINKVDVTPKRLAEVVREALEQTPQVIAQQEKDIINATHIVDEIHRQKKKSLADAGLDIGYKFVRKIGQGAMSEVYLAERIGDYQSLVLKVLNIKNTSEHAAIERFVLEAELIEGLNSPFVVKVFEHGLTDDYAFIAMEFFSRGDLKQRMELDIPPELAATYVVHIAYGLNEIHKVGVIHRDLKLANVMFRGDDLTTLGQIIGTPHYMSPEHGEGLVVNIRTDLYSAGVMLFELLMKEKPFKATTPAALIYQHVHEDVPRLPEDLSRFQGNIDKLMAKNPADRYQSASELISVLTPLQ